jgi:cytochrome d ubiquinol oxidase subunit I
MVLAAYITTCFVIGGVSAAYLLRNRHREAATLMLKLAVGFAAIAVPVQIFVGDLHGLKVHEYQPVKLAAIEAIWETEKGAPLLLFAVPNKERERNDFAIGVPRLGSLIITHDLDGEIKGLKEVPADQRPPVAPVFYAFRVMVGIGVLMLALVIASGVQWKRGRLAESKWILQGWRAMTLAGFVAVLAGWYTTEIGRQPYVIYGQMRTADALSAVNVASVATSLAAFATVYLFIFIAGIYYLQKLSRKGPLEVADEMRHPEDKTPMRPLSVPEEPVG